MYVHSLAINSNGDVFAGTEGGIFRSIPSANIKVFLQGPYSSGTMSTALRDNGFVPLAQPYNIAPFNYNGTEAVDTVPAGIVDWVLLELRSDLTTQVSQKGSISEERWKFSRFRWSKQRKVPNSNSRGLLCSYTPQKSSCGDDSK